jgi:hypothetical protein
MNHELDHLPAPEPTEPSLAEAYGGLYNALYGALCRYNPRGVGEARFANAYDPVIGTILPRWREARTSGELLSLIKAEFADWHGLDNIGPATKYEKVARAVWIDWLAAARGMEERGGVTRDAANSEELYAELYYKTLKILHSHDPVCIGYLPDEYTPEAETILPRLKEAHSPEQLGVIVYEEFVRWFSEGNIPPLGPGSKYEKIAGEVWKVWERYREHDIVNETNT